MADDPDPQRFDLPAARPAIRQLALRASGELDAALGALGGRHRRADQPVLAALGKGRLVDDLDPGMGAGGEDLPNR